MSLQFLKREERSHRMVGTNREPDLVSVISARGDSKMNCVGIKGWFMREEFDFNTAKRGPVASSKGKTRITVMLDDDVIEAAREYAESAATGYQTVINRLLRQALISDKTASRE